jgi:choline-sulfatase
MDSVTNAGVADVSNQLDYDDEVGFRAVRKLRDLARTGDERPWCVTVSFTHPHDPYVARQEFWDLYDDVEIPLPTTGPIKPDELDAHSARLRHVIAADVTNVTDEQIRAARRAYFANISYVDRWVGELLAMLDRHGMRDDTIVVFTADHGDMLGERGLWYKMNFFEHSAHIPLIIDAPHLLAPGRLSTPATLMDIAPTLMDFAGLDPAPQFDGATLVPFVSRPDPGRTVVGEYLGEGAVAPIFMIRRDRWKFVWSASDPPQLYDLDTDPSELSNLAGDREHADRVEAFTAEVHDRWDVARIDREVRATQRARADVDRALRQGRFRAWDFQPVVDASEQYMRNHLDLNDVEAGRRA